MIKRVLVLAALGAGAVLLTACDRGGEATRQDTTSTTATADVTRNVSAGDLEPVACGEIEVDGATHDLVAQPAATGIVGCTEAFNVIDEYLTIPAGRRGAALDGIPLANGWSCTTDDGETASIGCVQGRAGDDYEFAFNTEPV